MRTDNAKANAMHKGGAKREQKDVENRRQPKAASKRGHEAEKSGQGLVRRQDGKANR